jgi:hypothetical protein
MRIYNNKRNKFIRISSICREYDIRRRVLNYNLKYMRQIYTNDPQIIEIQEVTNDGNHLVQFGNQLELMYNVESGKLFQYQEGVSGKEAREINWKVEAFQKRMQSAEKPTEEEIEEFNKRLKETQEENKKKAKRVVYNLIVLDPKTKEYINAADIVKEILEKFPVDKEVL